MSLSVDKALSKAKSHTKKGEINEAAKLYSAVLDKFPKNKRAQHGLAALKMPTPSQGQLQALISAYRQEKFQDVVQLATPLAAQYPYSFSVHSILGASNAGLRRFDVAIESYRRALQIKPDNAEVHNNLGNALREIDDLPAAVESFTRAIQIQPDYAYAHNNLAIAQGEQGDLSEAVESYRRAIRVKPDYAEAYRNYSITSKFKPDDPFISKMIELIDTGNLADQDRMDLSFALGKAELDLGNGCAGIDHLKVANALRKKALNYNISDDEKLFLAIKAFFDCSEDEADPAIGEAPKPVFILGMPRSGTTLVEQIISSHSQVFGAGELMTLTDAINANNWQSEKWQSDISRSQLFASVRSAYIQRLSAISDAPIITDKMPSNFQWIGFMQAALPEAKIVHLKRDPAAVCWSIFKTYFPSKGLGFTFDLQDVAKYYKLYEDLMRFWDRKYPGKIYHLNYEALTENQEEETRKLFAYLELDWENSVMEFYKNDRGVRTVSNAQVRSKMYTGSSNEWKAYEEWLKPMLEILDS